MIRKIPYGGWEHAVKVSNGVIDLVATLDVGPRILRFGFVDGPNMFVEFHNQYGLAGESEFVVRGGHRFWHAPESPARTYYPDNAAVEFARIDNLRARLTPPPETENDLQKQLDIVMSAGENSVIITHRLTNIGRWNLELAPWAITALVPGGTAIVPLPGRRSHQEHPAPGYSMAVWSYTHLRDPRFQFGDRFLAIRQAESHASARIGLSVKRGWAAYAVHETLFLKTFKYQSGARYPNNGCNVELSCDHACLSLESVAPLAVLEPGRSIEYSETWRLIPGMHVAMPIEQIEQMLAERFG